MKSLLRNITVDNRPYVYWHSSGSSFTLNLSLKENKNTRVTLVFTATSPPEKPYTFWAFYDISAQYEGTETVIHLGKPRHIAEILTYLLNERPALWEQGKPQLIDNGWEILEEMGYADPKPIWVSEW